MNSLICNILSPGLCDSVVYVLSFISCPLYFIDPVEKCHYQTLHNEETYDCQIVAFLKVTVIRFHVSEVMSKSWTNFICLVRYSCYAIGGESRYIDLHTF